VLAVTATLRLRFANAEAERILAAADGFGLRNGRIGLTDRALEADLMQAVSGMVTCRADQAPACLFIPRPSGLPNYTLVVAPAGAGASVGSRVAATLFLTDPVGPSALPVPALLADGLGLTATEAEVARLAAMGRGMPFVAQSLGISLNTARTHLKAIYSKTGVNQQAALARLIADCFPPVAGLSGR
jgi:DNA-binding CsgD family transcriptional regulator